MWSAPADSKLCFRLTKTGRFNGEYTDKPLLISSSSVAFYISNYNSFEITKQIEPNVVSLSVYFMSEIISMLCCKVRIHYEKIRLREQDIQVICHPFPKEVRC